MDNGNKKTEDLILFILKKNSLLTIVEIAKRTGINRLTASKYLYSLETRKIVSYRSVGNAKLFYMNKKLVKA